MDEKVTIAQLKEVVKKFCDERDWDQYHNAKELAIGISTEGSELLQHFRFKSEEEIDEMIKSEYKKQEILEELADILYFLLRFAERYEIDLSYEFNKKMKKNNIKYPIEKCKGLSKKYNELEC